MTLLTASLALCAAAPAFSVAQSLTVLTVAWDDPGGELASMPIGNGDVAANVWVEKNGDLAFYLAKSDAWNEQDRLLKLGRVRVSFEPPLPVQPFRQTLDLSRAEVVVSGGTGVEALRVRVWVDANRPVLHVAYEGQTARVCVARVELWRKTNVPYQERDERSEAGLASLGLPLVNLADTVMAHEANRIGWYHRDTESIYRLTLEHQHLGPLLDRFPDPLLGRTFGVIGSGTGMTATDDTTLRSRVAAAAGTLDFTALTALTGTAGQWEAQAKGLAQRTIADPVPARAAHERWWADFWQRSWLLVHSQEQITLPSNQQPWRVGAASDGGSRFGGEIASPKAFGRELSPAEIADLARQHRLPTTPSGALPAADAPSIDTGCSVSAWIKPGAGEAGRILDKCTATQPDGFLLDTYPELSLRWIVADKIMVVRGCLRPGEWHHVAGTVSAASGTRRVYLDGRLLLEERTEGPGEIVTRGYALQRYLLAASSRGPVPPKFNGGLFTVQMPGTPDPDYRRWGGNYWFQNNRWLSWPLLATGDYDLMQPLFAMYRRALPLALARTPLLFGHGGAFFPETMHFWGTYNGGDFGWNNPEPVASNPFVRYHWEGSVELCAMMLDYFDHTRDEAFARDTLLPLAEAATTFYALHEKRDPDGHLRFEPTQSLESWQDGVVDDLPTIAGLRFILPRLLALPVGVSTEQKAAWSQLLAALPAVPTTQKDGVTMLAPAAQVRSRRNSENPELYGVFPFRLYGVGKVGSQIAQDTFDRRSERAWGCWHQDDVEAALLGRANEAARLVVAGFGQSCAPLRFPAFWPPGDWWPDLDNGGTAMMALNSMLLQAEGKTIQLLPAWPSGWDADFKLHAPGRTTLEGRVESGKIARLVVTPPERLKDVVILKAQ